MKKAFGLFSLVRRTKLCVIPPGITNTTRIPLAITNTKLFKPGLVPGLNNFEPPGTEPVRAAIWREIIAERVSDYD